MCVFICKKKMGELRLNVKPVITETWTRPAMGNAEFPLK